MKLSDEVWPEFLQKCVERHMAICGTTREKFISELSSLSEQAAENFVDDLVFEYKEKGIDI